jgi:hypothetical protein
MNRPVHRRTTVSSFNRSAVAREVSALFDDVAVASPPAHSFGELRPRHPSISLRCANSYAVRASARYTALTQRLPPCLSLLSFACLLACSGASPSELMSSSSSQPANSPSANGRGTPDASALEAGGLMPDALGTGDVIMKGGPSEPESPSDALATPSVDATVAAATAMPSVDATVTAPTGRRGFVQIATATPLSFVPSVAATFSEAQGVGDLNVVAIGWGQSTADVAEVGDSAGNQYRLAVGPTRGGGVSQSIYFASGIAASPAGNAVRIRFDQRVARADLRVAEYSGLDLVSPLDAVAARSGTGRTATSGAATTAHAIELVFGAGSSTDAFSDAGSLFGLRVLTADGNLVEDRTVASPGAYSADAVLSHGVDWVMQLATFR